MAERSLSFAGLRNKEVISFQDLDHDNEAWIEITFMDSDGRMSATDFYLTKDHLNELKKHFEYLIKKTEQ
jgi:hypothetical protein